MESNFSVIILAAGLSVRMGRPKALLPWDQSTTFLEKIVDEYTKASCNKIICIINKKTEPGCLELKLKSNVSLVINPYPEWGRFYSIKIGIQEVLESDFCFIQNVDNPFINIELINTILAAGKPDSWCSPVFIENGGHPILVPKSIIQKIPLIQNNDMSLLHFLNQFQMVKIDTNSDLILRNINTPEDYKKYFSRSL